MAGMWARATDNRAARLSGVAACPLAGGPDCAILRRHEKSRTGFESAPSENCRPLARALPVPLAARRGG